jgi:hypothetical protein
MTDFDNEDRETLHRVRSVLLEHSGAIPVFLFYTVQKEAIAAVFLPRADGSPDLLFSLEKLLGKEKVVLRERNGTHAYNS